MSNEFIAPIIALLLLGDPVMAQAPEFKPPYNFLDKPVVDPAELQATIMELSNTVNQLRANQQLLIRDDGTPIVGTIGLSSLGDDVTNLLGTYSQRINTNAETLSVAREQIIDNSNAINQNSLALDDLADDFGAISNAVQVNADNIIDSQNPVGFFKGEWTSGVDYKVGDQFVSGGVLYFSAIDHTSTALATDIFNEKVYQVSNLIKPGKAIDSYSALYDVPSQTYSFTTGNSLGYRDGESWYIVPDTDNEGGVNYISRDGLTPKRLIVFGEDIYGGAFKTSIAELVRYNQVSDTFEVLSGRAGLVSGGARNLKIEVDFDGADFQITASAMYLVNDTTRFRRFFEDVDITVPSDATALNEDYVEGTNQWYNIYIVSDEVGSPSVILERHGFNFAPPPNQSYYLYVGKVRIVGSTFDTEFAYYPTVQVGDKLSFFKSGSSAGRLFEGMDTISTTYVTKTFDLPIGYKSVVFEVTSEVLSRDPGYTLGTTVTYGNSFAQVSDGYKLTTIPPIDDYEAVNEVEIPMTGNDIHLLGETNALNMSYRLTMYVKSIQLPGILEI